MRIVLLLEQAWEDRSSATDEYISTIN